MVLFEKGTYVFLEDSTDCYVPAKVNATFEKGKPGSVTLVDSGRQVKVSPKQSVRTQSMDEQSLRRWPDMVVLKQLDNAALLHNIRLRYARDEIYTNIGTILISVNPYKQLPSLFGPEKVDEFIGCGGDVSEMEPHIYGVAEDSFYQMLHNSVDVSCIITGESGAGKTEATKLYLAYIAERSRRNRRLRGDSFDNFSSQDVNSERFDVPLREQILGANPIMEAFGNAKTVRNDNSSRFGKLIDVQFAKSAGCVVGGAITNYLLEKSRVVHHLEGERSYHIFYQLCSAANMTDPSLKQKYRLSEPDQYAYLNQSKNPSTRIDGVDDCREWEATVGAMKLLKMDEEQREAVNRVLAGILHLGNVQFTEISSTSDFAKVVDSEPLGNAADMFGVTAKDLEQGLLTRDISNRSETVIQKHNPREARDARDALAKHTYSRLFDFLTDCINDALSSRIDSHDSSDIATISVLDIFGFESFGHNSFEQLCINYCNEKLQGFFNNHIFKLEQEEYRREEIDVSQIGFSDNEAVIAAIDHRSTGIFAICDDQVNLLRGSDDGFHNKMLAVAASYEKRAKANGTLEVQMPRRRASSLSIMGWGQAQHATEVSLKDKMIIKKPDVKEMRKNVGARKSFIVVHFAGEVMYNVEGFLEKNRDVLRNDLLSVVKDSEVSLIRELFSKDEPLEAVGNGRKNKARKTLGRKFQEQLDELMIRLNATEPHFVRTIKPNSLKKPREFEAPLVLDQLRYAGLLEVCRIRQMGYPIRKEHHEFMRLYRCIRKEASDLDELLDLLVADGLLSGSDWQKGKTKVFMRANQFDKLNKARESALWDVTLLIQKNIRRYMARSKFLRQKRVFDDLETGIKKRDRKLLETSIPFAASLPNASAHAALLDRARRVLAEIKEEQKHLEVLAAAVESRDIDSLPTLIATAEDLGLGSEEIVKTAKMLLKESKQEEDCVNALREAIDSKDMAMLAAAVENAQELGLTSLSEFKTARALLERMKEEEKLVAELEDAISAKDEPLMREKCQALVDLGSANHPTVKRALKLLKKIVEESKFRKEALQQLYRDLREAIDARDLDRLNELRIRISELGADDPICDEAMALRDHLEQRENILHRIAVEMGVLTKKSRRLDGLFMDDLKPLEEAVTAAAEEGMDETNEPEVKHAVDLLERSRKQLEVQIMLSDALEAFDNRRGDNDQLFKALHAAQALGMETMDAQRVAELCRRLEYIELTKQALKNHKLREARNKALKYATFEEQEKTESERLKCMNTESYLDLCDDVVSGDRYRLENFYRIRSDDDYTEPFPPSERNREADMKLWSSRNVIPKSLHEVDHYQNEIAIRLNRVILQYCGDIFAVNRSDLAQFVVIRGLEDPRVADEVYLQLCKHIRGNIDRDSCDKAWNLMCMCTKYFPPSEVFAPYLVYFFQENRSKPQLVGNYARLCLAQLGSTMELGTDTFKPRSTELAHYLKRPPVLASINVVDGNVVELPISPDMRTDSVHKLVRQKTGIIDAVKRPAWAIFIQDTDESGRDDLRERLIRFYKFYNTSKLGSVEAFVSHWQGREKELFHRLTQQYGPEPDVADRKFKKINSPAHKDPKSAGKKLAQGGKSGLLLPITASKSAARLTRINNVKGQGAVTGPAPSCSWPLPWYTYPGDAYLRMARQNREPEFTFKRRILPAKGKSDIWQYYQLVQEVTDGLLVVRSESEVAELAAISLAVENENDLELDDEDALISAGLAKHIPLTWLDEMPVEAWAKQIATQVDLGHDGLTQLRQRYVDICKNFLTYGMVFFHATKADSMVEYVIGVDSRGIHVLNTDKDDIINSFSFKAIKKFGAGNCLFYMKLNEKKNAQLSAGMGQRLSRRFGGQNKSDLKKNIKHMQDGQGKSKGFSLFKGRKDGLDIILNTLQSWELHDLVASHKAVNEEADRKK